MHGLRAVALSALVMATATWGPPPRTAAAQSDAQVERAKALFEQGQRAYAAGRFDDAAHKMKQAYALTHAPDLAFNVARVYERMAETREAIRYFRIYLKRAKDVTDAQRADIEKRIEALKEIQKRQRDQVFTAPPSTDELTAEARTFFLRGVAMFKGHHYEAAMQAFTAAQQFAPLPEVLYNMAVTAERLRRWQDARDYYREYLRLRPKAPDRALVEKKIKTLRDKR